MTLYDLCSGLNQTEGGGQELVVCDWPSVSDLPELSGGHVVSGEEAVSGVPQVLTELLIQLLQQQQHRVQHD